MTVNRNKRTVRNGIHLKKIEPLTDNQEKVFIAFYKNQNLFLHGSAGTGKTYICLYLALKEIVSKSNYFKKIIFLRSAVTTRKVGFLPGTLEEKLLVYEDVFKKIINELSSSSEAYDKCKEYKIIEFMSTSFIRGYTFDDAIVIVDEAQNLSFHECDSIITRIGTNSQLIFCGDIDQSDINDFEKKNFNDFVDIISLMDSFSLIEFSIKDVVRSGFVKEYLIAKNKYFSDIK